MTSARPFTIAQALREWCFVQTQMLPLRDFQSAAKQRGLDTFGYLDPAPWETLDREQLLVPVAYALHGFWMQDPAECLDSGALLPRDEVGFLPWHDLDERAKHEFGSELTVLYHHWQLLWLGELQRGLRPGVPWGNLGGGLDTFFEMRARMAAVPQPLLRENLIAGAEAAREIELLLVRVQDLFLPQLRGGKYRAGAIPGLTDDAFEWILERRKDFDYLGAARECGVTAERLATLSGELGIAGHFMDPTEGLFWLIDQVGRSQRERLKGDALRALDHYDASRILRAWNFCLTDKWAPDVDELVGWGAEEVKRRWFGTTELVGDRSVLPALLDMYDLYPYRVELIGEGDSELAALREIFERGYGTTFERLGIHTIDMTGADMPANTERLLASVSSYANYFLLVFDNEGRAKQMIEALMRSGIIQGASPQRRKQLIEDSKQALERLALPDAERKRELKGILDQARDLDFQPGEAAEFRLWKNNLEADNFSLEEICSVVNTHATECGADGFRLEPDAVAAATNGQPAQPAQKPKALASVVVEACENHDPPMRINKPELARMLARYALEHPERDGRRREILDLAEHLYRLAASNRRLPEPHGPTASAQVTH